MKLPKTNQKGFTIIEVVLVLAIAALIFLMVFIALPALQRSQRDTARKNDVGDVASAVTNYVSNNNGKFPSTDALKSYSKDVSSNTTSVEVQTAGSTTATVSEGEIVVTQKTTCDSTGAANGDGQASQTLKAGTVNQFTVTTFVEAGGGSSFCQDS